jgi:uncharacterized protein YjhX (UPF0386 family)
MTLARPSPAKTRARRFGLGARLGRTDRLLGLALLGALLFFAGAHGQAHTARHAETAQRVRHETAQARLAAAQQQAAAAARLRSLSADGFLAPENRADWLRRLEAGRAEQALPSLRYRIEAARPWQPSGTPPTATGVRLRASRMALSLGLDHEAELEAFLVGLLHPAPGARPLLHACRLEADPARPQPPDAQPTAGANLRAECLIDWIGADLPDPS